MQGTLTSITLVAAALDVERAVDPLLEKGLRTINIRQGNEPTCTTEEFTEAVAELLRELALPCLE